MKFRARFWIGRDGGQISTPYLTFYWDLDPFGRDRVFMLALSIIVGELQLWFGRNLDDLL